MTTTASRAYAHRLRNGFLTALWVSKHNPNAFESAGTHAQKIIVTMLSSQANQKLGRKTKLRSMIKSEEARLLWDIQDAKPIEQKALIKKTCDYGLNLVEHGFIVITPDDDLKEWQLTLSPEGEELAQILHRTSGCPST